VPANVVASLLYIDVRAVRYLNGTASHSKWYRAAARTLPNSTFYCTQIQDVMDGPEAALAVPVEQIVLNITPHPRVTVTKF
jgi:hypothetical protein